MEWNNGRERALFEREQAQKRKEYLAAGMTEEQIEILRNYDEEWYRSCRREAEHTQRLNVSVFDEDDGDDESQNPLIKKFLHSFTIEDKYWENDRFGWVEEIESENLYITIKALSERDKEILTLLICDGFNATQVATRLGVRQQSISKRIKKFRIIFQKWL